MYSKILIATDGSELAGQAVTHGVALAKSVGASVIFVTVTETMSANEISGAYESGTLSALEQLEDAAAKTALGFLEEASDIAKAAGVISEIRHVQDRKAAEGIIETAELDECDLIVMASHGRRGLQKVLIGSQTAEVLTFGKTPVLVLR